MDKWVPYDIVFSEIIYVKVVGCVQDYWQNPRAEAFALTLVVRHKSIFDIKPSGDTKRS